MVLWLAGHSGLAAPHKLRVDDPGARDALLRQGGRLVGDYGSFQIVESDVAPTQSPGNAHVQLVDRFNFIRLTAGDLNTRAPELRALRPSAGGFAGKRLHLVQSAGPIKPDWLQAIERTGAEVVGYIPENAYLVYGDEPALARLQSWSGVDPSVQWEGGYRADYKLSPRARALAPSGGASPGNVDTFAIQMVTDDAANAVTRARIDRWKVGPVLTEYRLLNFLNVIVRLPAERLTDLAGQPDVISIRHYVQPRKRDESQDQILAGNLAGNVPAGPGYLAWLAAKGFTQAQFDASGLVVNVNDSGIDNGTTSPGHFGLYRLGDPALGSRVAYCRLVGTANPGHTLAGCDGHGTLNAHIIAGYCDFDGFPYADASGLRYGLGVCPFVKVGSSVIFDTSDPYAAYTFPSFQRLESLAYGSGARISNNSWGAPNSAAYDTDAQTYDFLVRDVSVSGNNRPMVVVFVAGNEGPDSGTIDSPGTAKNVITIGGAENVRSLTPVNGGNDPSGADGCGATDGYANSANDVASFSSRGPCADGRMKPDLLAPCTHVTGGVVQASAATNGSGSALPCFDATGVTALPRTGACSSTPTPGDPNDFFPLGQQFYTVSTGASHAAPAVSGACALLRQYFMSHLLTPPSPAMTKAYLINSARYMTGAYANDTLWSPNQGMGELNLGMAFDGVPRVSRDQLAADKFTATGQTRTFTGSIFDPGKPFRVTVAWTDAPGNPAAAKALVNDLDLTVTVGGVTYRGNVLSGASSVTGGTADSLNNVESVFLPAGQSNAFTVTVTAANIAANALTGGMASPQQDFALVIYNSEPPFAPTAGSYRGLFYQTAAVEMSSSGAFSAVTTAQGACSGMLQMGVHRYRFSGRFDASGALSNCVTLKGANPLTLLLQMDVGENRRLTGTVSDGTWTATLEANRAVFNARTRRAPYGGKYTLIVPGSGDPANNAVPFGDGYGTFTVKSSGAGQFRATLADGTKLVQTASVSQDGAWPLYRALYGGGGQVLGWLNFTRLSEPSDLAGWISWIKSPGLSTKFYPDGFNQTVTNVAGSPYNPAARPVTEFGAGLVQLAGGNLPTNLTQAVTVSANNRITPATDNPLTLTLSVPHGTFKGRAAAPGLKPAVQFGGVLLQSRIAGSGFFLGTNLSGKVSFGP